MRDGFAGKALSVKHSLATCLLLSTLASSHAFAGLDYELPLDQSASGSANIRQGCTTKRYRSRPHLPADDRQTLQEAIAAGMTEPASLHPLIDPSACSVRRIYR
jgi:hypothetical protein